MSRRKFSLLHDTQAEEVEYHRAQGWTIVRSKISSAVFAFRTHDKGVDMKGWRGKAAKPAFYYLFRTMASAEAHGAKFATDTKAWEEYTAQKTAEKAAKRKALKASDHWAVGDVVYTSWGYEQTNVEYYQIVKLKPRSVIVRQVRVNSSDSPGQPGGGMVQPRRYEFVGPEFPCPLDEDGGFNAGPCWNKEKPSFRHRVSRWDGRPKYTSSYH